MPRIVSWLVAGALAAAPAAAAVAAQRQPLPPPGQATPPGQEAERAADALLEPLLRLPGTWVELRYPADTLDRATRLQTRLETLFELWQPMSAAPLGWRGAVVTEEIWTALSTGRPWGVPARLGETFVAPAYGDAGTAATARRLLGGPVPAPEGMPLFGTPEEAGSLAFADVLLQLEAARAFVETAGFRCAEPWICGVLAHLAARLAWEVAEPGRTLEIVGLLDRVAAAQGGPGAFRLEEYGAEMPYERELWFQAQLVRGADPLWVEQGRFGTPRRLRRWLKQREPIGVAELDKEFPALAEWRRAAFAP